MYSLSGQTKNQSGKGFIEETRQVPRIKCDYPVESVNDASEIAFNNLAKTFVFKSS